MNTPHGLMPRQPVPALVVPLALSANGGERAAAMARKVSAQQLRFGYGLPLATARQWGLTISTSRGQTSIGIEEPALFSEPGLFLVRPDGTLYWGSTQTMPFACPAARKPVLRRRRPAPPAPRESCTPCGFQAGRRR